MKTLYDYILEDQINEGFLMNATTKRTMRQMDSKDLYTGVLNMYDYIVDNDDIKLFYKDFPMKERLFWSNLYNLYQKKVWSIFDANIDGSDEESFNEMKQMVNGKMGEMVKVTPEFRRNLRKLINNSKNSELDLKPSEPQDIMIVFDDTLRKYYIFTINRTTGLKSIFRPIDAKFLEEIFNKLAQAIKIM